MRVAVIDIGTVSVRLMIASVQGEHFEILAHTSSVTNLGEAVDATQQLSEEAMRRTLAVIEDYLCQIDTFRSNGGIESVHAVATSAARDASNASVFLNRLSDLGLEVEIISGDHEVELSFLGAANDFRGESLLFVDIGGGSTELCFGTVDKQSGLVPTTRIQRMHSFNIGARRLTERFLKSDPPTHHELHEAYDYAFGILEPLFADNESVADRLVAVAGTPTTVVAVRDKLVPYDRSRVHKAVVDYHQFMHVFHTLTSMPCDKRCLVEGMQQKRAGIFPAGALILKAVMDLSGMRSFTVSEQDLLVGMVLDSYARTLR